MTQTVGLPRRIKYTTADPAEAREFLAQMCGADVGVAAPRDTRWQMMFSLADAGDFSTANVDAGRAELTAGPARGRR